MTEARNFYDVLKQLAKHLLEDNELKDYRLMTSLRFSPQSWSRWRPKLIEAISDNPKIENHDVVELANVFYNAISGEKTKANIRVNFTAVYVSPEKITLLKEFADLFRPTTHNPNTNFVFDIHFDTLKHVSIVRACSIDFNKKSKTWLAKPEKPKWELNGEWQEIPEKFLPLLMKAK